MLKGYSYTTSKHFLILNQFSKMSTKIFLSSTLKVARFQSPWWNIDVRVRLYHMTFMTFTFRHYLCNHSCCPAGAFVTDKSHVSPYLAILLRAVPSDSYFLVDRFRIQRPISTLQLLSVGSVMVNDVDMVRLAQPKWLTWHEIAVTELLLMVTNDVLNTVTWKCTFDINVCAIIKILRTMEIKDYTCSYPWYSCWLQIVS